MQPQCVVVILDSVGQSGNNFTMVIISLLPVVYVFVVIYRDKSEDI